MTPYPLPLELQQALLVNSYALTRTDLHYFLFPRLIQFYRFINRSVPLIISFSSSSVPRPHVSTPETRNYNFFRQHTRTKNTNNIYWRLPALSPYLSPSVNNIEDTRQGHQLPKRGYPFECLVGCLQI